MRDEVKDVIEGDGFTVGSLDGIGEGYGFRKVRRSLGVEAFGVNAIVLPAGYEAGFHFHDEQEELYFVHEGRVAFEFADGSRHVLGPGGLARVDPRTARKMSNVGDTDATVLVTGGKGGYVGRDGRVPEDEDNPRGDFSGPPGATGAQSGA